MADARIVVPLPGSPDGWLWTGTVQGLVRTTQEHLRAAGWVPAAEVERLRDENEELWQEVNAHRARLIEQAMVDQSPPMTADQFSGWLENAALEAMADEAIGQPSSPTREGT